MGHPGGWWWKWETLSGQKAFIPEVNLETPDLTFTIILLKGKTVDITHSLCRISTTGKKESQSGKLNQNNHEKYIAPFSFDHLSPSAQFYVGTQMGMGLIDLIWIYYSPKSMARLLPAFFCRFD